MQKVLIISDNDVLVQHLKEIISEQALSVRAFFDFCFSESNEYADKLRKIGLTPINLKNAGLCKKVVNNYDLVLSLHSKQIFPPFVVRNVTCINFHPGFNPYNRGWYPQVFSIINKKPAGVTIHLMDDLVDHGSIIVQEEIPIQSYENSSDVYKKLICLEKSLVTKYLGALIDGSYHVREIVDDGNYNSIEDFKNLCRLDLNQVGTLGEHIDLLRAVTHDGFRNAFYFDNGAKVYVSIGLEVNR